MGVEWIALSLAGPKRIFNDGDIIEGICDVQVGGHAEVSGIFVRIRGVAKAKWQEKRKINRSTELPLLYCEVFLSPSQGTLTAGFHQLPFAFHLPRRVATTCETSSGCVRYWLEAEEPAHNCVTSGKKRAKLPINVLQLIDTNLGQYMFPVIGHDLKSDCCCCCSSSPIFIEAKTDRAAYCPGDVISITASFRNDSKTLIRPYAKLLQRRFFRANGHEKIEEDSQFLDMIGGGEMAECSQDVVCDRGHTTWKKIKFRTPLCLPSLDCIVFQINYFIEVGLDVPWAFDLAVYLPVIIGTIPLRLGSLASITSEQPAPGALIDLTRWSGIGKKSSKGVYLLSTLPTLNLPLTDDNSLMVKPSWNLFDKLFQCQVPVIESESDD